MKSERSSLRSPDEREGLLNQLCDHWWRERCSPLSPKDTYRVFESPEMLGHSALTNWDDGDRFARWKKKSRTVGSTVPSLAGHYHTYVVQQLYPLKVM